MKKLSEEKISDLKFLTKFYKALRTHEDEVFLYVSYPRIKPHTYVLSNYGKVIKFQKNKVLKGSVDKDGYLRVSLNCEKTESNAKVMTVFIHRLVAWEFCKKEEECNIVNHIDANKLNNYCGNLEWTTVQGNTLHAIEHGLTIRSGFGSNGSKYEEELILDICHMLEEGLTPLEVFKTYYPMVRVDSPKYRNFYQEIYRLKYDENFMKPVRSRFNISTEKIYFAQKPWTPEQLKELKDLILSGKDNKEILHHYGFNTKRDAGAHRIYDKTSDMRKALSIPNPDIERFEKMRKEIFEMVKSGKTNEEIMKVYGSPVYRSKLGARISNITYKARKELNMENPIQNNGSTLTNPL